MPNRTFRFRQRTSFRRLRGPLTIVRQVNPKGRRINSFDHTVRLTTAMASRLVRGVPRARIHHRRRTIDPNTTINVRQLQVTNTTQTRARLSHALRRHQHATLKHRFSASFGRHRLNTVNGLPSVRPHTLHTRRTLYNLRSVHLHNTRRRLTLRRPGRAALTRVRNTHNIRLRLTTVTRQCFTTLTGQTTVINRRQHRQGILTRTPNRHQANTRGRRRLRHLAAANKFQHVGYHIDRQQKRATRTLVSTLGVLPHTLVLTIHIIPLLPNILLTQTRQTLLRFRRPIRNALNSLHKGILHTIRGTG